jgi:LysM repeat protein
MEPLKEERNEPRVEIGRDLEEHPFSSNNQKAISSALWKKMGIGGVLILGMAVLSFGLWSGFRTESPSLNKDLALPEITFLKNEIAKLKTEVITIKSDLQAIKEGQKGLPDQVKGLQEPIATPKENSPTPAAKKDSQKASKSAPKPVIYSIRRGDNFSSIAKKFRVAPNDLRRWNRLPQNSKLKPGQLLTIYPPTP